MNKQEKEPLLARMKELVPLLNEASKAYYQENREIMSNYEYDRLYDELLDLEKKTQVVLSNSPSIHVGYELLSELQKERHPSPMLSLDKTKEVSALAAWLEEQEALLSWKMDGLTIVLTYENGQLSKAVTRGNGEVGEVVTNNARMFVNLPGVIPYKQTLVLRGEAVILYSDFEQINAQLGDVEAKYKNPRNLCSGAVRQLNNEITANRKVHFYAFSLVQADGVDFHNSLENRLLFLQEQGFEVVGYEKVNAKTIADAVGRFSDALSGNDFPSDGLVLSLEDIAYGKSLGTTAKFPRDAIAFKWKDEIAETVLREIEWSPSRTGLINPIAVFDPVELEGTTVSRASLHNISIMEELELGIGDTVTVYKANMIIPQVADNLTRSACLPIAESCPACGAPTKIQESSQVKTLVCTNEYCSAKKTKLFAHFVSRNAMNIEGLSEATLEKLIDEEMLTDLPDIYRLEQYHDRIIAMDGFGEKSYQNMIDSIEKSRHTSLARLLYAIGIPNVGVSNAKLLCKEFEYDFDKLRSADLSDFTSIAGIGEVIGESIIHYFENQHNQKVVEALLQQLILEAVSQETEATILSGKTFVITGSVHHFANRDAMKEKIESLGGKATGSVTKNTDYLINNDVNSNSSKNKKAKELGIPIISEEEFLAMIHDA
ncbi:MAG: NAD-dependent DNA ligase LigA [Lachnospiraceae bacterium]